MDINKASFDIVENTDAEMSITPFGLATSFDIQINKESIFSLIIYGFNLLDKYILGMKMNMSIVAHAFMRLRAVSLIKNKMNISINHIRELLRGDGTFSSSVAITFLCGGVANFITSLSKTVELSFIMKQIYKTTTTTISTNRVDLVVVSSLRAYRTLNYWASSTLTSMDSLTLNQIDYEEV